MSRAFGKKKKALVTTPKRKLSGLKDEFQSPGAPGEELEGEFEGFVPEGKFFSIYNHVRLTFKVLLRDSIIFGRTQQTLSADALSQGSHL